MSTEIRTLDIPDADATAGDPTEITILRDTTVFIHQPAGGAAFSLKVQGRIATPDLIPDADDADWVDLSSALTTPALVPMTVNGAPVIVTHIRIYRTSIATGANPPVALYAGRR